MAALNNEKARPELFKIKYSTNSDCNVHMQH